MLNEKISVIPISFTTWTTGRYICEVIKDRRTFIQWLIDQKLIPAEKICEEGHVMRFDESQGRKGKNCLGLFRCRLKHSDGKDRQLSCGNGTFFEKSHLLPEAIVMIFLLFANDLALNVAFKELSFFGYVAPQTILNWFSFCHEIISEYLLKNQVGDGLLGGKDSKVEIDVLGFGERKRYSKCIKKGMYILGFIEHGSKNFCLELTPEEEKHNARYLLPLIQKHVQPGTTVMCDSWLEFNEAFGYKYFHFRKVNYEGNNKSGSECRNRDNSEPAWRLLKRRLISEGIQESEMADYFTKFLFSRKMTIDKPEPFEILLEIIRWNYPIYPSIPVLCNLPSSILESSDSTNSNSVTSDSNL